MRFIIITFFVLLILPACRTPLVGAGNTYGSVFLDGKSRKISITEIGGVPLAGYKVLIDEEYIGKFLINYAEKGSLDEPVEFSAIDTKYGKLDMVMKGEYTLLLWGNRSFDLTLDGKYLGSVQQHF